MRSSALGVVLGSQVCSLDLPRLALVPEEEGTPIIVVGSSRQLTGTPSSSQMRHSGGGGSLVPPR